MHGVNAEPVQKEVFPDVILMPNVGMKAMMWQETAGVKRDTSARFVFPVMTIYSLQDMMIETCGRFRWEMCRKIQGMRWNDITEKSLTSEYCDYIQYYRKTVIYPQRQRRRLRIHSGSQRITIVKYLFLIISDGLNTRQAAVSA